jgi:hypothetical protein
MTSSRSHATAPRRSRFVTGIAWLSIVGSASGVLSGALWTVGLLFAGDTVFSGLQDPMLTTQLPPSLRFISEHLQLLSLVCLVGSGVMLATSIGLLRRREWARISFVWILVIGVLSCLAMFFIHPFAMVVPADSIPRDSAHLAERQQLESLQVGLRATAIASVVCFAAINALVIAKLSSATVREEFDASE